MRKIKPHLATEYTCTGCMACVDCCGVSALQGEWRNDGHLYVTCDSNKCTSCGKCEKICPIVGGYSYKRENTLSIPYTAWANDDEVRMNSSSGGIFAAIAYSIIENGGYVAGSVMEGTDNKHILSNKAEDIARMQGSKYQQGDLTGVYKAIKEKLKESKTVFFSGVPCQVGALYSFLGKLGESSLLLTADLICSGFPTRHLLKRFIEEKNKNEGWEKSKKITISYRNKDEGWEKSKKITVSYHNKDEGWEKSKKITTINYGYHNFVYHGFACENSNRYSCGDCKYCYLNRKSDLTLADFWNEKRFSKQHYKGVSLVAVHSHAGKYMLEKSNITLQNEKWETFLPLNKMICNKIPLLKLHPARRLLAWNFRNLSFASLEKLYGGKISKTDVLWLPYKVFNYVLYLFKKYKFKKITNSTIKKLKI